MSELIQADLLKWLRDNQWLVQNGYIPKAHAVIGDPPYFLGSITKRFGGKNAAPAKFGRDGAFQRQSRGFMGKTWDGFEDVWEYQAWVTEWATLLLDYVYPGAVVALFGSPRTYHRLAAGLEDAGFEIFDTLMFLHGQGFPKNHNISKAIDRKAGAAREIIGIHDTRGDYDGHIRESAALNTNWRLLEGRGDISDLSQKVITAPATDAAKQWDGYGTHLKPAYEPIVLCRAPRGSATYAELAQTWGTGAINVDGARIGTGEDRTSGGLSGESAIWNKDADSVRLVRPEGGRYPANLALDEAAARLLDAQSGESVSSGGRIGNAGGGSVQNVPTGNYSKGNPGFGDVGGASRFFYTAKAASWEREAGLADFDPTIVNDGRDTPIDNAYQRGVTKRRNTHPTVKSINLCQWLATLLLPPPLDVPRRLIVPFAGSGSEMLGAQLAGWDEIVGIEREAEYCAINEARRRWWAKFKTYEQAEMAYRPVVETTDDLSDLPLFAVAD